jgi:hypothetical protein
VNSSGCLSNFLFWAVLQATRSQAERQGQRLGPLITNVNPQVFQRPTFRLFFSLLDNYKR